MKKLNNKALAIVLFSLFTHFSASATLISTDLTITASIGLGFGIDIDSDTSNLGSFSIGSNTGNVNNETVGGDSTSGVNITDTDQTLNFDTDINSLSLDYNTYAYDFDVLLENNHLTDTFSIDFSFSYANMASALVTGFMRSHINLYHGDDEFFSDLMSDADFGNKYNGDDILTDSNDPNSLVYGGGLSDAGVYHFSYILTAGQSVNFVGFVEAFFGYTNGVDGLQQTSQGILSIDNINQTRIGTPPVDVPEPSSLLLFLIAFIICARTQSQRI